MTIITATMTPRLKGFDPVDEIDQYIDRCLIEEDIYETDQLTDHEFSNFLNLLMKPDNDTLIRQEVLLHMQKLMDERKVEVFAERRWQEGYRLQHRSNGDVYYKKL